MGAIKTALHLNLKTFFDEVIFTTFLLASLAGGLLEFWSLIFLQLSIMIQLLCMFVNHKNFDVIIPVINFDKQIFLILSD